MAETEQQTPTETIIEKPYKKMAPKFFAFTPQSNGHYNVTILVNYDKAKQIMRAEKRPETAIKEKLRGTIAIYKQPHNKNRPELVEKFDIQEFRAGTGGYFATHEPTTMLDNIFTVEGINEGRFDRTYYSIYVELESTEDLDDIGILVHKGHKPPIM